MGHMYCLKEHFGSTLSTPTEAATSHSLCLSLIHDRACCGVATLISTYRGYSTSIAASSPHMTLKSDCCAAHQVCQPLLNINELQSLHAGEQCVLTRTALQAA